MTRLLILGTGGMARTHAEAFAKIAGVTIVGAVDNRPDVLADFADRHRIRHRFASLDQALDWGGFDACANVTPDAVHHPTTLPLIAADKHVLCEKPLATSAADAAEMADAAAIAADRAGVVAMVNLTYRRVPAMQTAARMVAEGQIGTVRHFEASYLQSWLTQPAWGDWKTEQQWLWRLSTAHGSKGCLGDVGIHILDFATFVAGSPVADLSCRLRTYDKAPGNRIGDYVLDANDGFAMHLELENGAIGTVSASRFASGHQNDLHLRIWGDGGGLDVRFLRDESRLFACLGPMVAPDSWLEVPCDPAPSNYETFIAAINGRAAPMPDFRRGAELQAWLDAAEASNAQNGQSLRIG